MADAILSINTTYGVYDFSIDDSGDIATEESFDTAILYSIYGERRASHEEVIDHPRRRGWIGNDADFENGSKLWLFEQSRLTRSNLSRIEDEARKALQWMVDDRLAVSIGSVTATVSGNGITLTLNIERSRDKIDRRSYNLWENTGAS